MGIKQRLLKDSEFVVGALVALYGEQTVEERATKGTYYKNRRGFNSVDAEILSRIADFYLNKGYITERQLTLVKRKLTKYHKQIATLNPKPLPLQQPTTKKTHQTRNVADLDDKGKIIVKLDPKDSAFRDLLQQIKEIHGRRWTGKHWELPMSIITIKQLKDLGLEFGQGLRQWWQWNWLDVRSLPTMDVKLKQELYPYQKVGIAWIEATGGRCVLGDEMGLGKTAQALAWLKLHPELRPVLVICPNHLKINWAREMEKWLGKGEDYELLYGTKPYLPVSRGIWIINYDIMKSWTDLFVKHPPKVLILDESHYVKNSKALRTKAVKKIGKRCPHVIAITGTLSVNRPVEMFTSLNLVRPDHWPQFWQFAWRYCDPKNDGYGWDLTGASNTEELHAVLTHTVMIRRRKEDVLPGLPPKQRNVVPLEIDNRDEYFHAAHDFLDWLREYRIKDVTEVKQVEALTKVEYLKQVAVRGKLQNLKDWIKDFLQVGRKLVVFATHHFVIDELMKEFKDVAVKADGRDNNKKRQQAVDSFQEDPNVRLFIGNIKVAGTGLTLTAAQDVAFVELGWSPGEHDQAEDRCHRIGTKSGVVQCWYLIATDTIEEDIAELIDKKRQVLASVLDGQHEGVEEKSLLTELLTLAMEKWKNRLK